MSEDSADQKPGQLRRLSKEFSRIAIQLRQLSMRIAVALPRELTVSDVKDISPETISWLIRIRRERSRYLPEELFGEPAWDMLLELLHAELSSRRLSVSNLCIASGAPPTTSLRWLNALEQKGLIVRSGDSSSALVELSGETSKSLRSYFAEMIDARDCGS